MFITLLVTNFAISLAVAVAVAALFSKPVAMILSRVVSEPLSYSWGRFVRFALVVVGISSGVRIWELEKYITPRGSSQETLDLNNDRWALEVYRTVIETLQSCAWLLLVFFMVALVAVIIVRGQDLKNARKETGRRLPPDRSGPALPLRANTTSQNGPG